MKELPSNEFRKTFASLREPVVVTVHGHPIARYEPILPPVPGERFAAEIEEYENRPVVPDNVIDNLQKISSRWPYTNPSPEFHPAPKPTKTRRRR